jgi:HK97 family phage major capsid protein
LKKLKELRMRLAALTTEERSQLEKVQKEDRGFDATEKDAYEKRAKDIGDIEGEIQQLEQVEERLAKNTEREERLGKVVGKAEKPGEARGHENPDDQVAMKSYRKYVRGGMRSLAEPELRALSQGSDIDGGYLRMPMQMVGEILKGVDNVVFVRQLARTFQIGGSEGLGVPNMDSDVNDADWTPELTTGNEDTAFKVGKRELRPHPLAKRLKISNKLIRSSVTDVPAYLNDRMSYKFGVTEEKGFLTGDGNNKPLGVFTASADGISTARDVSTGNSTTAIGADNLIETKHSLKVQYWNRPDLRWVFHRDAVKQIRKLKDGNGQYLWQQGLSADLPNRILEAEYVLSEYAPNTFTTGLYVGFLGCFGFYWIVDSVDIQLQVLDQLYAESNQTGYIMRRELDGQPVLEEAFARVKLA